MSAAIEVLDLSKNFGSVQAVDGLSFTARAGAVTGFLGPNGAGKTTTLRMLLGLVQPDGGSATILGQRYADLPQPGTVVGADLDTGSHHPGRTARDHLRVYAPLLGVGNARCDEVLSLVGLSHAARRRVGGFSLGMRQRLGLATTLLGDPQVLVLDEPANGLDPEGVVWLRALLRHLAGEGRTVLVSSHALGEVQATVDDVVIIAGGRLVHESSLDDLVAMVDPQVHVATPDAAGFERLAREHGWTTTPTTDGLLILGASAPAVGEAAYAANLEIHGLGTSGGSLEDVFLRLTEQPDGAAA